MDVYRVKQFRPARGTLILPDVPASKSILNRALLLAALSRGRVRIICGGYADDTEALLGCLTALGVKTERTADGIFVEGCGGQFPNKSAALDVRSAGTAARFLTAALAFVGGDYTLTASPQMQKRPMEILEVLERAGVKIGYLAERGHFPFRLRSGGLHAETLTVDTDRSTQYASGLLLAAACTRPVSLRLTGSRTHGSYIAMTLRLLEQFGARWTREGDTVSVTPAEHPPKIFEAENDLSGACYFYALALLFPVRVLVERIHFSTGQGDIKFLKLLEEKGVVFSDTPKGILADGTAREGAGFTGWDADLRDFSDQALTLAALAPFAATPTRIRGVEHIRGQECDRIRAITENLTALGVPARAEGGDIFITPAPIGGGTVKTFDDHRVAMAFALIGLKTGNVNIENPACCQKTFGNYFQILSSLTRE